VQSSTVRRAVFLDLNYGTPVLPFKPDRSGPPASFARAVGSERSALVGGLPRVIRSFGDLDTTRASWAPCLSTPIAEPCACKKPNGLLYEGVARESVESTSASPSSLSDALEDVRGLPRDQSFSRVRTQSDWPGLA